MASTTSQPLTSWLELPLDLMINILGRVSVTDIIENVEKVCTTWCKICKDPAMWRVIKMDGFLASTERPRINEICKRAVDRSQGQLVDLTIEAFGDCELLQFVAHRSSQLRRLVIAHCYGRIKGSWNEALMKFPLLEELSLYNTEISKEAIETAGCYCPLLKTVKVNRRRPREDDDDVDDECVMINNEFAKAIGENLVGLRHLELIGCRMSDVGLCSILNGCCHLESLDLRNCRYINLTEDLQRRCSELLKHHKLHDESLKGCPYIHKYYGINFADLKPWLLERKIDFEFFLMTLYDDPGVSF